MNPGQHFLSFDIEEHWRSYESRGLSTDLPHVHDLEVLDRIIAILGETGNRATFFVLSAFAKREPSVVRRIIDAGHEVASHGHAHLNLTQHTQASFREDTLRAKAILEDLSGQAVLGYRAAQWSLMHGNAWALDILSELGHTYDSSLFPGRIHRFGWPEADPRPHRIRLQDGSTILEFPASRLGWGASTTQGRGGFYWRALPTWIHDLSDSEYGCWYFHTYDLSDGYPLPEGLPLKVRLLKKLGTGSAWKRFVSLLRSRSFIAHRDALA